MEGREICEQPLFKLSFCRIRRNVTAGERTKFFRNCQHAEPDRSDLGRVDENPRELSRRNVFSDSGRTHRRCGCLYGDAAPTRLTQGSQSNGAQSSPGPDILESRAASRMAALSDRDPISRLSPTPSFWPRLPGDSETIRKQVYLDRIEVIGHLWYFLSSVAQQSHMHIRIPALCL